MDLEAKVETERPLLVVVGGGPATGKTTLARLMSRELGLPVLSRDHLKEAIADVWTVDSLEQSKLLGKAAYNAFYHVVAQIVDARVSLVAEANYHRGVSESHLSPLTSRTRMVLVHCQTEPEVSYRRYVERYHRGERHPCHFDGERIALMSASAGANQRDRYGPLDLAVPSIVVNTTDDYSPSLDAILEFVRGQSYVGSESLR